MKKILFLPALALLVCELAAAEIYRAKSTGDWDGRPKVDAEGVFTVTLPRRLISMKSFKVDPAKTYTLSGEFRIVNCDKLEPFFFGFMPKSADNIRINAHNMRRFRNSTLATVASDAPAGSAEVTLLNAENWPVGIKGLFLAADAKADDSDLPNFKLTPVKSIRISGGKTVVTLGAPLKYALAKDSCARLHAGGASFIYTGKNGGHLSEQWQTFSGTIGAGGKWKWYPGTAQAAVVIVGGGKNGEIQFRNITVNEE